MWGKRLSIKQLLPESSSPWRATRSKAPSALVPWAGCRSAGPTPQPCGSPLLPGRPGQAYRQERDSKPVLLEPVERWECAPRQEAARAGPRGGDEENLVPETNSGLLQVRALLQPETWGRKQHEVSGLRRAWPGCVGSSGAHRGSDRPPAVASHRWTPWWATAPVQRRSRAQPGSACTARDVRTDPRQPCRAAPKASAPPLPALSPARAFSAALAERRTDETPRQSAPRGPARQPMNAHRRLPGLPARSAPAAGWGHLPRRRSLWSGFAPGRWFRARMPQPRPRSLAGSAAAQAVAGEQASRKSRLPSRGCCCDRCRDSDRPGTSPRPPHTGLAASGFAPRPPAPWSGCSRRTTRWVRVGLGQAVPGSGRAALSLSCRHLSRSASPGGRLVCGRTAAGGPRGRVVRCPGTVSPKR